MTRLGGVGGTAELVRTGEALRRRDTIVESVSVAAQRLLRASDWSDTIDEVLGMLGEATGVSRVSVWENNVADDGSLLAGQRSEWVAPGIPSTRDDPPLQCFSFQARGLERWVDILSQGDVVSGPVHELPLRERAFYASRGVVSVIVVPIFVEGAWWGGIAFHECEEERRWSSGEEHALRIVANVIGAAIERERAEARRLESEELFRAAFECAHEGVALLGLDGRWLKVNRSLCNLLGYAEQEFLATTFDAFSHADDAASTASGLQRLLAGEVSLYDAEPRFVDKLGDEVWTSVRLSLARDADGRPRHLVAQILDVTERRRAKKRLREAERRYRALVERVPLVTYAQRFTEPAGLVFVSPQIEELLGISPEEWRANPELRFELVHPDDLERVRDETERWRTMGEPTSSEYRFVARDGRVVWVRDEATVQRDETGRPVLGRGYLIDITEQKRAQERLRGTEEMYRALVEQIPAIVYADALEPAPNMIYVSPAIEILGFSPEEWSSELWRERLHPDDRDRVLAEWERSCERGEPFRCEYRIIAKDGSVVWLLDEAAAVGGGAATPGILQGIALDVTQWKQAEEEGKAADRLKSKLAEEIIELLEARGVPSGTWLVDVEQVRRALQDADAVLRRLHDAIVRSHTDS